MKASKAEQMNENTPEQNISGNGGQNIRAGKKSKINAKQKTVIVNPPPKVDDPAPTYQVDRSWKSPLTQSILTWIGTIATIIGLAQAFGFVVIGTSPLRGIEGLTQIQNLPTWLPFVLYVLFAVSVVVAFAAWNLRRIVKLRLRVMPNLSILPSAVGENGRVVFQYLRGNCLCGGKLRFYNKPIQREPIVMSDGSVRQKVVKRSLAAECVRNDEHWWPIDRAEAQVM